MGFASEETRINNGDILLLLEAAAFIAGSGCSRQQDDLREAKVIMRDAWFASRARSKQRWLMACFLVLLLLTAGVFVSFLSTIRSYIELQEPW
jgi:hypothetical protein